MLDDETGTDTFIENKMFFLLHCGLQSWTIPVENINYVVRTFKYEEISRGTLSQIINGVESNQNDSPESKV